MEMAVNFPLRQRYIDVGGPADVMALAIVRTRVVSLNTKGDGWNVNNAGGGAGVPVDSAGFVCFGSGGSAMCLFG